MAVYVTTDGIYDDMQVTGVFSTMEKAEEFIGKNLYTSILMFELDGKEGEISISQSAEPEKVGWGGPAVYRKEL